jgi:deazaflavin-dependent oxidoreductase (nitroreductase family)
MSSINFMNTLANPFVKLLARSPLHNLMDEKVVLITYTGRKSGKASTVPVNYLLVEKTLHIISLRNRNWWRNLKGGAPVEVLLKGKKQSAWAVLVEDQQKIAEELDLLFRHDPKYAHYLKVHLNENGIPDPKELLESAINRVVVIIKFS